MSRCTVPHIFGLQKWFDDRFLDLCEAHDAAYVTRVWKDKTSADFILAAGFAHRGHTWLAILSLFYTIPFGTIFWSVKKWKP